MTNEEAIVVLQKIKPIPHRGDGKSITHTLEIIAIDKAIKALEHEAILDKIRAEIEDLTYYCWEVSPRTVIDDVLEIIDKYKAESEDGE